MVVEIDYYITMVSKIMSLVNAEKSVRPKVFPFLFRLSKRKAEGGFGGNSAFLLLGKNEASPATLQFIARHHRKILFSLREKEIRRAQIRKSEENFFVGWRVVASGGGAGFLSSVQRKFARSV